MTQVAAASLPSGHIVGGRFRVERKIGSGGMGQVYDATHVATGGKCALKLLLTPHATPSDIRRFVREARAATAIGHPNVIRVFDVFEEADGVPVIVMELLEGESLAAYEKRLGCLGLDDALEIFSSIADALRATHDKGITHRDLKPDNIFLSLDERGQRVTKILDFGVAKITKADHLEFDATSIATEVGAVVGTPLYMSYEQAMAEPEVDHRADIWAFGVMLVEALSGRRPLIYDTYAQMYAALLQQDVPAAKTLLPGLPEDLLQLIDICLRKRANERLSDIRVAVDVLKRCALPQSARITFHGAAHTVPPRVMRSRFAMSLMALGTLGLVALLATSVLPALGRRAQSAPLTHDGVAGSGPGGAPASPLPSRPPHDETPPTAADLSARSRASDSPATLITRPVSSGAKPPASTSPKPLPSTVSTPPSPSSHGGLATDPPY